jgi:hypothetical protein
MRGPEGNEDGTHSREWDSIDVATWLREQYEPAFDGDFMQSLAENLEVDSRNGARTEFRIVRLRRGSASSAAREEGSGS